MTVPLEAFLGETYLAGSFSGTHSECRAVLDSGSVVDLDEITLVALAELEAGNAERSPTGSVGSDEIMILALPRDPDAPHVHKVHFPVRLTIGPYVVTGELTMFPGFDPARALTRPTSDFIDIHDAIVRIATPTGEIEQPYDEVAVNRFAVEHIVSEIDMTFWFPGAEQELLTEEAEGPPKFEGG
jgi:hypothetical protein